MPNRSSQNINHLLCSKKSEKLQNCLQPGWNWHFRNNLKMQALEYLLIGSAIFFIVTFFWLLNVIGIFDCFKSSPVKSAFHCLNLILSQSDQILAKSSSKLRQTRERVTQSSSNQLVPYTGVWEFIRGRTKTKTNIYVISAWFNGPEDFNHYPILSVIQC